MNKDSMKHLRPYLLIFSLLIVLIPFFKGLNVPLVGSHKIRQADTLFTAYSYCKEASDFLYPKTVRRAATEGIAIGEFPLTSWLMSVPCSIVGEWSESQAKTVVFLLFSLSVFIWGLFFKSRFGQRWPGWPAYLIVFIFSAHTLSYLLLPLPDLGSVFFAGLAALFYEKGFCEYSAGSQARVRSTRVFFYILAVGLFAVAFLIRPYMISVLALILPFDWRNFKRSMSVALPFLLTCILAYIFWYKYWVLQSQAHVYTTQFHVSQLFERFGEIAWATLKRIGKDLLNFVGVVLVFWLVRNKKIGWSVVLNLLGAVILTWVATTYAVINHGYYLTPVWVLVIALVILHFSSIPVRFQNAFLILWVLIGLSSSLHSFNDKKSRAEQAVLDTQKTNLQMPDLAKIVIYDFDSGPILFYRLKAVGYSGLLSEFKDGRDCPADVVYYYNAETKILGRCISQ